MPATNIDVVATLPAEMRFAKANRRTKTNADGQGVSFQTMEKLDPGQSAQFSIEVDTLRPGDVRFRMEIRSPALEAGPIIEEQATQVLIRARPPPAGEPAAPVPPPPPPPL